MRGRSVLTQGGVVFNYDAGGRRAYVSGVDDASTGRVGECEQQPGLGGLARSMSCRRLMADEWTPPIRRFAVTGRLTPAKMQVDRRGSPDGLQCCAYRRLERQALIRPERLLVVLSLRRWQCQILLPAPVRVLGGLPIRFPLWLLVELVVRQGSTCKESVHVRVLSRVAVAQDGQRGVRQRR